MRGSPILRAGLILFAFLLLLLPLRKLTSSRANSASVVAPPAAPAASFHLTITSTSVPFRFEISHLGKTVWKGASDESSSSKSLTTAFGGEREEPTRIEVTRGDNAPIIKTLWGNHRVDDVVTFAPSQ